MPLETTASESSREMYLLEEILDRITHCLELPPNPDRVVCLRNLQVLAGLSCVSKQLRRLTEPGLYQVFPGHYQVNATNWLGRVLARPDRSQRVQHVIVDEFVRMRRNISVAADREHADNEGDGEDDHDEDDDGLTDRETLLFDRHDRHAGPLDESLFPAFEQLIDATIPQGRDRRTLQRALAASKGQKFVSLDLVMSLIVLACPYVQSISIGLCDGFDNAPLPLALTATGGTMARSACIDMALETHGRSLVLSVRWPEFSKSGTSAYCTL